MTPDEKSSGDPRIDITLVIQGKAVTDKFNPYQKLQGAVQKVLSDTENTGQPHTNWQLRTEDGRLLDISKSFSEENIESGDKLFLSPKVGIGGVRNLNTEY